MKTTRKATRAELAAQNAQLRADLQAANEQVASLKHGLDYHFGLQRRADGVAQGLESALRIVTEESARQVRLSLPPGRQFDAFHGEPKPMTGVALGAGKVGDLVSVQLGGEAKAEATPKFKRSKR